MDSRYFRFLQSIQQNDTQYSIYRPTHYPLVLMSKSGIPLAAVGFDYQERQNQVPMLVKRPTGEFVDYQCLFPAENKEFKIIISNLTEFGGIKIDIGRNNVAVDETDPGSAKGCLNDVNELPPLETYEILGDQKDSLAFLLKSVRENGRMMSVERAESSSEKKGTFYYVSVVPKDTSSDLIEFFKDTYWDLPEYIITSKRVQRDYPLYLERPLSLGHAEVAEGGALMTQAFQGPRVAMRKGSSLQSYDSLRTVSVEKSAVFKESSLGFAADVTGGRQVNTKGNRTGFTYVYNVPSNTTGKLCCVSLSFLPKMDMRNDLTDKEIMAIASSEILEILENRNKSLLEEFLKNQSAIYQESACVVCLEEGNDAIVYRCGHQCMHLACVGNQTRCPMCRSRIVATIPAALAPQ